MDRNTVRGAAQPPPADLLGDWSQGPGPLYRRLADALARLIGEGALPAGGRLPSERELARGLAVSRATVVAAYDVLRAGGLADSRPGSGTRVARRPRLTGPAADGRVPGGGATSVTQRMVTRPERVISLGQVVEPGSPDLAGALLDLVREDLPALLLDAGYHPAGLPALRAAIAAHHTAQGLPTVPEQVLVTTGATQALSLATQLLVRRGGGVAVEAPSWPGCIDTFRAAGARLVQVPMDDEGIRIDALARVFRERQPAVVFTMPTCHNPTGVVMAHGRRRRLAELAAAHGVAVIEDNAHAAALPPGGAPPPLAALAPGDALVLTLGSLSKAVWAGLRIGWVRAAPEVVEPLARLKARADLSSPLLDQALAARLLPALPAGAAERGALRDERLDHIERLLRDGVPAWRWRRPQGGSALWIELPDRTDARAFAQVALRHGVEVVPGAAMDPDGGHDHCIRVPFSFPAEVLSAMADRLTAAWTEWTTRDTTAPGRDRTRGGGDHRGTDGLERDAGPASGAR
ncbi:PLP-dependent aminotransferase family protein [Streptomyces sp. NPDC018031]|uniref:aminotransferase-like domain-containing protein n=1 Tax=Streptomyces sp. NPDC018031 TaxID=3365033 RepID=UPI0037B9EB57